MSLTETTYWVVGASFALYIVIAIRSRASTTQEFYVAGKGIHPIANGMATAADWMSAASFISMAGLIGLLRAFSHADRALLAKVWKVHRARIYR